MSPRKLTVTQQALKHAQQECIVASAQVLNQRDVIAHVLQIKTSASYVRPEQATDAVRALLRWSLAYLDLERLQYPDSPGNPQVRPDAPVD